MVFFGGDGGLYKANDVYTVSGTSGWQELNNNLGVTQFYGAAGNATSGVIIGGTQDNGTLAMPNALTVSITDVDRALYLPLLLK